MATATKTWTFAGGLTSWVGSAGSNCTLAGSSGYVSGATHLADGSGCIGIIVSGRNKTGTGYFDISGSWATIFGIPAGSKVQSLTASYWRQTRTYTATVVWTPLAFDLRDAAGTSITKNLIADQSALPAGVNAWGQVSGGSVPLDALEDASVSHHYRINCSGTTSGSVSGASLELDYDEISVTITYLAPVTSSSFAVTEAADTAAGAGAVITAGTLSATEAADTATASGVTKWVATMAATEGADTTGKYVLKESYVGATVGSGFGSLSTSAGAGIKLTPNLSYTVKRITLKVIRSGNPSDSLVVSIAETINGADIATSDAVLGSSLPNDWTGAPLIDFNFSTPVSFTSGVPIYIRVTRTGAVNANSYGIYVNSTNGNPYAVDVYLSDGVWYESANRDSNYYAYQFVPFSGLLPATGTLAVTEAADTGTGSGVVEWAVALAATEEADTASSSGTVADVGPSGDMAVTEDGVDTASASGTVTDVASGDLAATEGADTCAADGGQPTQDILQANVTGAAKQFPIDGETKQAYVFTCGIAGKLSRVDLEFYKYSGTTKDIVVELWSTDANGLPLAKLNDLGTVLASSISDTNYDWRTVDVTSRPSVTQGTRYAIVWYLSATGTGNYAQHSLSLISTPVTEELGYKSAWKAGLGLDFRVYINTVKSSYHETWVGTEQLNRDYAVQFTAQASGDVDQVAAIIYCYVGSYAAVNFELRADANGIPGALLTNGSLGRIPYSSMSAAYAWRTLSIGAGSRPTLTSGTKYWLVIKKDNTDGAGDLAIQTDWEAFRWMGSTDSGTTWKYQAGPLKTWVVPLSAQPIGSMAATEAADTLTASGTIYAKLTTEAVTGIGSLEATGHGTLVVASSVKKQGLVWNTTGSPVYGVDSAALANTLGRNLSKYAYVALPSGQSLSGFHSLYVWDNKLWGGNQSYRFVRFNNLEDLSSVDKTAAMANIIMDSLSPGARGEHIVLTYESGYCRVYEVHPTTLAVTQVINQTVAGVIGESMTRDATYLYVLIRSATNTFIRRFLLTDYSYIDELDLSAPSGHAIRYDAASGKIFVTAAANPAWIARIDPGTFTKEDKQNFDTGQALATDDFALVGDYAFVGLESPNGGNNVIRVSKADLTSRTGIMADSSVAVYCVFYDGRYVRVGLATTPMKVVSIDPATLTPSTYNVNDGQSISELALDSAGRLYATSWADAETRVYQLNPWEAEAFTVSMTGLSAGEHYYVRAFSVGESGTISYGDVEEFDTLAAVTGDLDATEAEDTFVASEGALAEVTGDLDVTESADTGTGSGAVEWIATLAATEDAADTATAAAEVDWQASLSATEEADTAAGAGTVGWAAALEVTESADTATGSGVAEWSATLAATESAEDTAAAAAEVDWQAALSATEDADTAAGAGITEWVAALEATEEADTAAVSGLAEHLAALAATEEADMAAASGVTEWQATLAATDAADTAAAAGGIDWQAALSVTEDTDTATAAATVAWLGVFAATEAADTLAASGVAEHIATMAVTEGEDTFVASEGVLSIGTLVATEEADTGSLSGEVTGNAGDFAATEVADTISAGATIAWLVALAVTESADTLVGAGLAAHIAVLAVTEGADTLTASGKQVALGTLAATESTDTASASGAVTGNVGAWASTEAAGDSASGTATVYWLANLVATDAADTLAASALAQHLGALAVTEGADTATVSGAVTGTLGLLAAVEGADTLSASGTRASPNVTGAVTTSVQSIAVVAAGTTTAPVMLGAAAVLLRRLQAEGTGTFVRPQITGSLDLTLPKLQVQGDSGIRTGSIIITLPGLQVGMAGTRGLLTKGIKQLIPLLSAQGNFDPLLSADGTLKPALRVQGKLEEAEQ